MHFQFKKALQVFGAPEETSLDGLPPFARSASDNRILKSWSLNEMPEVGSRIGFMKQPEQPIAAAVFVTKGGVLKSSLTLNLARMAALHGIRTCVVGLDMQGDITSALSNESGDEDASLEDAFAKVNSLRGLADVFRGVASVEEVTRATDIPTLSYIPETPELVALDQSLINRNRREYWLRDSVVEPLKRKFDLVLMDCSPNWNRLITNALVAADTLVSPVECKINNFRNLKIFRALIQEFRSDMRAEFAHAYVATRLSANRKLSREIFDWYGANLTNCLATPLRESVQGEEATALKISVPEHAPTSAAAQEMRGLLIELWKTLSMSAPKTKLSDPVKRAAQLTM